jgi:hypothetical protein
VVLRWGREERYRNSRRRMEIKGERAERKKDWKSKGYRK